MKPIEFARKHFKEFKEKGDELIPVYCPFCEGGQSHDKYSFALNMDTGAYNCKRGSCNVAGSFRQLQEHYGYDVRQDNFEVRASQQKKFTPPKTKPQTPGQKVEEYLTRRGISKETWTAWGVSEHEGNVCFPYYENGKPVLMKFRRPEKYTGEGQKAWREEGGKAVFWGMDKCSSRMPLIITEGEFDALAVSETGLPNVVSVPSGASDLTCVDHCWDWLQRFKKIIIWPDSDEDGQEMCRRLIQKLGAWRCYVAQSTHKDANEALHKEGPEAVLIAIEQAKEVPIAGLIRLADVKAFDYDSMVRVPSGVRAINQVAGGYMGGLLSVWTGENSSGKSTFLGQELLEAVDSGHAVCVYSGELPAPVFRYWIDLQAAGPGFLSARFDSFRGGDVMYPQGEAVKHIREWYRDMFFLYDSFGSVTDDTLLKVFEYAAMRYDCKVFLIDNLMATAIESGEKDYYRKQADFVKQVKEFAVKFEVHVHLVAHPRKTQGRLTKMDVSGAAEITNWADNVFGVYRVKEDDRDNAEFDAIIDIFKNRFSGRQDEDVGLLFEPNSKRFYQPSRVERKTYKYGWQKLIT